MSLVVITVYLLAHVTFESLFFSKSSLFIITDEFPDYDKVFVIFLRMIDLFA